MTFRAPLRRSEELDCDSGAEALPGLAQSIMHFLFPARCLFCREALASPPGPPFCLSCRDNYRPGARICPQCENFSRGPHTCFCRPDESPLRDLFTIALYDPKWRRLIHDLKYKNRRAVARPLGTWLAAEIKASAYCAPDLVTFVPLHPGREKERGYNQSELLARRTARALGAPAHPLLARSKNTPSQTTVSRLGRRENVRGAFKCVASFPPATKILLIDDVYTTGSTLQEAAAALASRGAFVFGAVVAYNPHTAAMRGSGFYAGLEAW